MPNMPSLCKMTWRACCPPTACPLIGHCTTAVQHTATHCNTLQHTVKHCNTLQHTATHLRCTTKRMHQFADGARLFEHRKTCPSHTHNTLNTLQHTATHCNTLQHTATHRHSMSIRCSQPRQVCLWQFPVRMLHPRNLPNPDTQIPRYKYK